MDLRRRGEIREWFLIFLQYSNSGDAIPSDAVIYVFTLHSVSEKWGF